MIAGLLLSTDYVVLRWFGWLISSSALVASNTAVAGLRGLRSLNPFAPLNPYLQRGRQIDVENVVLPGESVDNMSIRIRGQTIDGSSLPPDPAPAPAAQPAQPAASKASAKATESLLAVAAAASNLLSGKVKNEPHADAEDEEELSDEEEAVGEESEAVSDEEVESATEDVMAEDDGPRVRRKKKGAAAKQSDNSLEHLDDTSLPEGTEEYVLPGVDLLTESDDINFEDQAIEVRRKAKILETTFADFGFNVRVVEIETGPVIAQYEVELEAGLRLSKITSLADDLAIALRVPSVRIVAPIRARIRWALKCPTKLVRWCGCAK